MAKYTFDLRELISTFGEDEVKSWFMNYELTDFLTPDEVAVITSRGTWSKEQLADRIVNHFMLREIGQEAPGSFILMAKDLMNEIMETYAPLIYSASIKYDPLVNVDFTETYDRSTDNQSKATSSSSSEGSGLSVNSDTPQGQISKSAILGGSYASSTSANESENKVNDQTDTTGSGNEHYTKTTRGNSGVSATAQKMIEQYRDNIRALNTEIVYRLEPLFMAIY